MPVPEFPTSSTPAASRRSPPSTVRVPTRWTDPASAASLIRAPSASTIARVCATSRPGAQPLDRAGASGEQRQDQGAVRHRLVAGDPQRAAQDAAALDGRRSSHRPAHAPILSDRLAAARLGRLCVASAACRTCRTSRRGPRTTSSTAPTTSSAAGPTRSGRSPPTARPGTGCAIRPHVLRDVSEVSTSTTVLGAAVATPVLVAPTAYHELASPLGESATAAATAAVGSLMTLSTFSTQTLERVAEAAPGCAAVVPDVRLPRAAVSEALAVRAAAAGYRAIVAHRRRPRARQPSPRRAQRLRAPAAARHGAHAGRHPARRPAKEWTAPAPRSRRTCS